MAIVRTAMIDDSGSGTDGTIINNAWKQELYNQIDALHGANIVFSTFALTDASGAGLVIGGQGGFAVKMGTLVCVSVYAQYPATANGAAAKLGGLPYPCHTTMPGGLYVTYGPPHLYGIVANTYTISPLNASTMAARTNAELSGATVVLSGLYFTY